jgi:hypothetical protein
MRLTTCRCVLWTGFLAVSPLIGLAWFLLYFPGSRINEANAGRIQVGMTLEEVQAILGPERNEAGRMPRRCMWGPKYRWGRVWKDGRLCIIRHERHWVSEETDVLVCFDNDNRVSLVECGPAVFRDPAPTLWEQVRERIRNWIG